MLKLSAQERKERPIFRGALAYFPDAIAYVGYVSKVGNDQHNPGEPMHWARGKSMDQGDALVRHQADAGTMDTDGVLHSGKVAWRALAQLQLELEAAAEEKWNVEPNGRYVHPEPPIDYDALLWAQTPFVAPGSAAASAQDVVEGRISPAEAFDAVDPCQEAQDEEDDPGDVVDAIGSEEELVSEMETFGDMVYDAPPPKVGDTMVRRVSADKPRWVPLSSYTQSRIKA